ncbi:MAG: 50S ribosomal protein L6 [Bacteroidales bacterium]|nr:50S ribosomal protein L6 [Bacteroidales bacterium]
MSRIGKLPIAIPAGVTVNIDDKEHVITVKGKLGELSQKFSDHVILEIEGDQIHVKPNEAVAEAGSKHGLYRALIHNMVKGVSEGFETVQEFVGVGYKAEAKGQILEMALGYSHTIFMEMPPEIKIETINERGKNPILKMRSYDKQLLGQVAAKIRSMRKPEPYKGKGIKFQGEVLRRKAGKAAGK